MRILIQAILAAASIGGTSPPPAAPSAETLAIGTDIAARMTLPAEVNGRGPYRFLIDTGADHSVVSDQLADKLSLVVGPPATVYGIQGRRR